MPAETGRPNTCGRRTVVLGFAIAVLLLIAWVIHHALLLIYVSAVLAVVLKPSVDWLHRRSILGWRPGRGAALLLIVLVLCVVLGSVIAVAVPSIVSNLADFADSMTGQFATLQNRIRSLPLLRNIDQSDLQSRATAAIGRPRRVFRRDEAVRLREAGWSWRRIAAELDVPVTTVVEGCKALPAT